MLPRSFRNLIIPSTHIHILIYTYTHYLKACLYMSILHTHIYMFKVYIFAYHCFFKKICMIFYIFLKLFSICYCQCFFCHLSFSLMYHTFTLLIFFLFTKPPHKITAIFDFLDANSERAVPYLYTVHQTILRLKG